MVQSTDLDPEHRQRRALRRNRAAASALLVLMAGLFIATALIEERGLWLNLLHATAEAGVIGGLADWFAITALFRRPLGLPIPHTAILPRSKNRIGEGLGLFLERHFLTEELVVARLRALDLVKHVAQWLADQRNAQLLADRIVLVLPHVAAALDDEEFRSFTGKALGMRLRDVDVASLAAKLLGVLTAGGHHAGALDHVSKLLSKFLEQNAEELIEVAADAPRRRWWMPSAVNKQVARGGLTGLRQMLEEMQRPDSVLRSRALSAVDDLIRDLTILPAYRDKLQAVKNELLEHPEMQRWLRSIWDELRHSLLNDILSSTSYTRDGLARALASVGHALQADASMSARLNQLVEEGITRLLPWRSELARFVSDVVQRWDEKALVRRMELALGADLQYVRFTGTLVGASIGFLLAFVPYLIAEIR